MNAESVALGSAAEWSVKQFNASRFTQQCCHSQIISLKDLLIMKTSRIAALALIATAATGFNAYAEYSDNFQPAGTQKFVSTLTRAQVHAEAVKATREAVQRGYNTETGEYLQAAPQPQTSSGLTREAVRAEAIKARSLNMLQDSAG